MRTATEVGGLSILFLLLLILTALQGHLAATVAPEQHQATLTEWTIPTPASGVTALTLEQSGSCCWFVEYYGNKLGHFDPTTNTFQEWAIPTTGSNPYDLTVTSNPASPRIWGTEFATDKIFAFSPETNLFREYSLTHGNTGVGYISVEPTGTQVRVWFTETIINVNGELIYDQTTGNATLYEDTFPLAVGGGAYGVYAESNSVWFAGFSALVRWDRATQQYTMWQLPAHGSAIGRFITIDSYGQVWYTQGTQNATSGDNFVGVLRNNGMIEEWRLPSQGADPRKISINPQSLQPWIAERSLSASTGAVAVLTNSTDARFVTVTPTTYPSGGTPTVLGSATKTVAPANSTVTPMERSITGISKNQFTEFAAEAGAPNDVVVDSQGNVWFSEPGTNKIAELSSFTQDFALSATPPAMSLPQGSAGTASILATAISGYQGSITVGISNLPRGVTTSNGTNTLVIRPGAKNASIQLPINVAANAPLGSTAITFEGSDGVTAHATSILLTITNSSAATSSKTQCIIAAATYGSNLSQEVELLRGLRDNILRSKIGSNFFLIFNSWYYSFSPKVANYIDSHPGEREGMKDMLYPLIGALALSSHLYVALSSYPEFAALLAGLLASFLIGSLYVAIPLVVIKRAFRISLRPSMWLCLPSALGGLCGLLVGLAFNSSSLLMISSLLTVLSTLWGSGTLVAEILEGLRYTKMHTSLEHVAGLLFGWEKILFSALKSSRARETRSKGTKTTIRL